MPLHTLRLSLCKHVLGSIIYFVAWWRSYKGSLYFPWKRNPRNFENLLVCERGENGGSAANFQFFALLWQANHDDIVLAIWALHVCYVQSNTKKLWTGFRVLPRSWYPMYQIASYLDWFDMGIIQLQCPSELSGNHVFPIYVQDISYLISYRIYPYWFP